LQHISDYLRDQNPQYREPTMRKIYGKIQVLKETPHIGRPGRIEGTRELLLLPMRMLSYIEFTTMR
jgi:plasmid stabilization system protein ParE